MAQMHSAFRIVMALPGREKTLHQYKRPVDFQLAHRKMAGIASMLMPSWGWVTDTDFDAIEDLSDPEMMLLLLSSDERPVVECAL